MPTRYHTIELFSIVFSIDFTIFDKELCIYCLKSTSNPHLFFKFSKILWAPIIRPHVILAIFPLLHAFFKIKMKNALSYELFSINFLCIDFTIFDK